MRYREYPPPADLREWVDCLWTLNATVPGPRSQRVLPDGCIDILFEVGGARGVDSYLVGMMTRPLIVDRTETSLTTAVRFRPGGAAAFWRGPLDLLTDARVELREVWPRPEGLVDRLAAAATEAARIELLVAELRRRRLALAGDGARRGHAGCRLAVRRLARQPETGVRELCAQLGVSRQALARSFREHVGVPPKTLARVLRLQRALRLIQRAASGDGDRVGSLADLAAAAGFYDQSHMVAEWRELVGLTPSGFLAERAARAAATDATAGFPFFQDGAARPE